MSSVNKIKKYGSRAQVMHGTALMTSGNLKKSDLIIKDGRIRSKKKSSDMKTRRNVPNFIKALSLARKKTLINKDAKGKLIVPNKNKSASNTKGGVLYKEAMRIFNEMKQKYK